MLSIVIYCPTTEPIWLLEFTKLEIIWFPSSPYPDLIPQTAAVYIWTLMIMNNEQNLSFIISAHLSQWYQLQHTSVPVLFVLCIDIFLNVLIEYSLSSNPQQIPVDRKRELDEWIITHNRSYFLYSWVDIRHKTVLKLEDILRLL